LYRSDLKISAKKRQTFAIMNNEYSFFAIFRIFPDTVCHCSPKFRLIFLGISLQEDNLRSDPTGEFCGGVSLWEPPTRGVFEKKEKTSAVNCADLPRTPEEFQKSVYIDS
tara:strand:+ start:59 stop:388 length:330 start_codon:yes stop_codon:yes gene_type:complete